MLVDTRRSTAEMRALALAERPVPIEGPRKFLIDLKYLFLEQILEIRTTWYWHVIFALFLPIAIVFGFARVGSGLTDRNSLLFIVSGSAIFSVANDGLYVMAARIGVMKKEGMLVYYASLPISKAALVIAVMTSRLIITLPGMLTPILFGSLIYHVSFDFNPWIIVLLPLTGLALSSIGMALGSLIDNLEIIQIVVNALLFILVMAAPVFIPMASLPLPLQIVGVFMPPTYAAAALRDALSGAIGPAFFAEIGVLFVMMIASFFILNHWLTWRLK